MRLPFKLLCGVAVLGTFALVAQAQVPGGNSTLQSMFTLAYDNSTMMPSYTASAAFAPTATAATDICNLTGSATKTVKVRRILVNLTATTAVTVPIGIIKRSTANTGGTIAIMTTVPLDSGSPASGATPVGYTANPTVGTAVGLVADPFFSVGNLTTGGAQGFPSEIQFGRLASPVVLRGVAQSVSVSLGAASLANVAASCTFEWTEQ